MSSPLEPLAQSVLAFWFGADAGPEQVADSVMSMWFRDGASHDATVRERFGTALDPAAAGAFDHWCETPRGRLALIVLTDQFPRHVHRGTARAFGADAKAREVCLAGLRREHDQQLDPIERVVYYLPLEHAENLALQERCVAAYRRLAGEVGEASREGYENYLFYAAAHRDIIARFGRFPHRSAVLGRALSDTELAFLDEPNSSF